MPLLSQHSMCTLSCLRRILRFCLYLYSSVSQSLSCSHVSLSSVHVLVCLMCPVFPCPVFRAFSFGSSMSDYVWLVPAVFPSCFPPPHILSVFSPLPIGELSHVAVCFLMCLGFLVFLHLFYIAEEVDGFFFSHHYGGISPPPRHCSISSWTLSPVCLLAEKLQPGFKESSNQLWHSCHSVFLSFFPLMSREGPHFHHHTALPWHLCV